MNLASKKFEPLPEAYASPEQVAADEITRVQVLIDELNLERINMDIKDGEVTFDVTDKSHVVSQRLNVDGVEWILRLSSIGSPWMGLELQPAVSSDNSGDLYDISINGYSQRMNPRRVYSRIDKTTGTVKIKRVK